MREDDWLNLYSIGGYVFSITGCDAELHEMANAVYSGARVAAGTAGITFRISRIEESAAHVYCMSVGGGEVCRQRSLSDFFLDVESILTQQAMSGCRSLMQVHAGAVAIGGAGVTTRLPRLIGAGRAKEMLWTGRPVGGDEAVRIGLANSVHPSAELLDRAKELANSIAAMSPFAVAASKAVVNASAQQETQESLRYAELWSSLIAMQKEATGMPPPPSPLGRERSAQP